MSEVLQVSDSTFEQEVLMSDRPVLVDFWAPWCGPCRQIAPVIDELSRDNEGSFKVVKVNIDDNPRSAQKYGVMSIPTLLLFKKGNVVEQIVGARPKAELQRTLDLHRQPA